MSAAASDRLEGSAVLACDVGDQDILHHGAEDQGTLVSREGIPVSAEPYQWLGAGIDGNPLPAGSYSIELESLNGETVIATTPVEHYARVIEAKGGGTSGTRLVLVGGAEVLASDVTALREPQG